MNKCKDGGECGLGGYCDDCYQVKIAKKAERIKQLESELEELKQKANTIYKLKCECDKCGHVWVERMEKE